MCWVFFPTNLINLRHFFVFSLLSICKSKIPLTSAVMNLIKRKHNCDIELFSLFFQFFTQTKPVLLKNNFWDSTEKQWLTEPERMNVNKHCVFQSSKSKTIHGGTSVRTIMYISITKGLCTLITHLHYFLQLYLKIPISLLAFFIVYVHHFIYI